MERWHYTWTDIKNINSITEQAGTLKQYGDNGWQLVSTILIPDGDSTKIRFYWKRNAVAY